MLVSECEMDRTIKQFGSFVRARELDALDVLYAVELRELIHENRLKLTEELQVELALNDVCLCVQSAEWGERLLGIRGFDADRVRYPKSHWWWYLEEV